MNKITYMILLIGSFLLGWYDNGDITFFVMLVFFGVCGLAESIISRVKRLRREYKIIIKRVN